MLGAGDNGGVDNDGSYNREVGRSPSSYTTSTTDPSATKSNVGSGMCWYCDKE